jgi:hypothetical protein
LYEQLRQRLGATAEIIHGGAEDVSGACDVLFVSSVLYYLKKFPSGLLRVPCERLVVSHLREYHDTVVTPVLCSAGWVCESRRELAPRIEPFCGFLVRKDGTEVAVWRRGNEAS